jgi:hypothetical protein
MKAKEKKADETIKKSDEHEDDESIDLSKALDNLEELVKSKKGKEKEVEEKDDDDDEDEDEDEKSFDDSIEGDEDISKAIEVSDFLKSLVDITGTHIDGISKSLTKSISALDNKVNAIGEAVIALAKSQQQLSDDIDSTPATSRKSIVSKSIERFSDEESIDNINKSAKISNCIQKLAKSLKLPIGAVTRYDLAGIAGLEKSERAIVSDALNKS